MSLQIVSSVSDSVSRKGARAERSKTVAKEVFLAKKKEAQAELKKLTSDAVAKWSAFGVCARKTALAYWSAGRSLHAIREYLRSNRRFTGVTWLKWCEQNNIAKTSADQAILVGTSPLTQEEIEKLDGITAVKIACGIVKPKEVQVSSHTRTVGGTGAQEVPPTHEPESALSLLVKINTTLGLVSSMPIPEADYEGVKRELDTALDLLSTILTTVTVKVAA